MRRFSHSHRQDDHEDDCFSSKPGRLRTTHSEGKVNYTTNGTTPTTASTLYSGAVTVSATETLEAIAAAPGYTQSAPATVLYTITSAPAASTPVISPGSGSYVQGENVTLTDSTPGSTIYYTVTPADGLAISAGGPGENNFAADEDFVGGAAGTPVSATIDTTGVTNPAPQSVYQNSRNSNFQTPNSFSYVISTLAPVGNMTTGVNLTPGASYPVRLHFAETYWNAPGKRIFNVCINGTQVLTNFDIFASAGGQNKAIVEQFTAQADASGQITILFTTVTNNAEVSGIEIPNTAGNPPSTFPTSYSVLSGSSPISVSVSSNETIEAMATAPGYSQSPTATAVYTTLPPPADTPVFSLTPGTYVGAQPITITEDMGGTIYYTTDGSTPTTSSPVYTNNTITVSATETIQAIAAVSGYAISTVGSATYNILSATPAPTFTPAEGSYASAQLVTINDALNATTYYTIKAGPTGSNPALSSAIYTPGTAISVGSTETLEAFSVEGSSTSAVATATYTLPAIANSTTTLGVNSAGSPVTSVASGSEVTLTATVMSGTKAVTTGTVNFCNMTAATATTLCTDIHLLGTAQLTSAGTASINIRPSIGSHSYEALFIGTSSQSTSMSTIAQLTVTITGKYSTATGIMVSGAVGDYTVTSTVTGLDNNNVSPTGTVSILDTSNGNAILGTGSLSGINTASGFTTTSTIASSSMFYDDVNSIIGVGDFNGDGKPDMALLNYNSITIMLGNGDGTFTQVSNDLEPVIGGSSLAVGDFNGDGVQDLALLSGNSVKILLGNGDGTFKTPIGGIPLYNPNVIAVGDFNRDGKLDVAVADYYSSITILLGKGDGTFTAAENSPATDVDPASIAVGDINGDGIPDLAVATWDGTVDILLGKGDGTFTPVTGGSISVGNYNNSVVMADFDGDGNLDLAVADVYYGYVYILLNKGTGDGTFKSPTAISAGNTPYSVVVGDFNRDGKPDLAFASNINSTVEILTGDGSGGFINNNPINVITGPLDYGVDFNPNGPEAIVVGDFNGDGTPDLAVANVPSTVTILFR